MATIPEPQNSTIQAIYDHYEQTQGFPHRHHLGASIIGRECERELWYSFHWATSTSHSGRLLRLFETGQNAEQRFIDNLRAVGVAVWDVDSTTGDQHRVSALAGHFGGSLDGIGQGLIEAPKAYHVLEFKTHGDKSFKTLEKGVLMAKPEHYAQMQCYMGLMQIDRAYYMAVNKNTDELYGERVRYDEMAFRSLLSKAERVIFSDRPPAKMSEDAAFYKCKFCDHSAVCHQGRMPEVNCRTCAHSTATDQGNAHWKCSMYQCDIDFKTQRDSGECPGHIYNPNLIPAQAIDSGLNSLTYQTESGQTFKNGEDGYSSKEIKRAGSLSILASDAFQQIRKTYDGEVV